MGVVAALSRTSRSSRVLAGNLIHGAPEVRITLVGECAAEHAKHLSSQSDSACRMQRSLIQLCVSHWHPYRYLEHNQK